MKYIENHDVNRFRNKYLAEYCIYYIVIYHFHTESCAQSAWRRAASLRYPGDDVRDFHHFPRGNARMKRKTFRSLILKLIFLPLAFIHTFQLVSSFFKGYMYDV